jgi:hypothetical protein
MKKQLTNNKLVALFGILKKNKSPKAYSRFISFLQQKTTTCYTIDKSNGGKPEMKKPRAFSPHFSLIIHLAVVYT